MSIYNRFKTRVGALWTTRRQRIDRAREQAVTAASGVLVGLQNAHEIATFTVQAMLLIEQVSGKKLPGNAKALAVVEFLVRALEGSIDLDPTDPQGDHRSARQVE